MVITVNISIDPNPACLCGNRSGELMSGDGHCHCCDCGGVVVLNGWTKDDITVTAANANTALEYLRLSGLDVSTLNDWISTQAASVPQVCQGSEVLRDFS